MKDSGIIDNEAAFRQKIDWDTIGGIFNQLYIRNFTDDEFLINNVALFETFQNKGIFTNIIYPDILNTTYAKSIVMHIFKNRNYKAYTSFIKNGFKEIYDYKFELIKDLPNKFQLYKEDVSAPYGPVNLSTF